MNITYNGIRLTYCTTREFRDEPVYTRDGQQYEYTRRTIRASCLLSPATDGVTLDLYLAQTIAALQFKGKQLTVHASNSDLLLAVVGPDLTGGPFPRVLSVHRVDGNQAAHVEWEVTTCVNDCAVAFTAQPEYIAHRWSEFADLDEGGWTTWTRRGYLKAKFALWTANPVLGQPPQYLQGNADRYLRGLVVPPLARGFKRLHSHYHLSEDGLELNYEFRDKETEFHFPDGIPHMEGSFIETSDQMQRWGTARIVVKGDNRKQRQDLLAAAVAVAFARLKQAGIWEEKDTKYTQFRSSIHEDLYEPRYAVEFTARLAQSPAVGKDLPPGGPGNAMLARWGSAPLGSAPGTALPYDTGTRGTAALALIANVLKDPCGPKESRNAPGTGKGSELGTATGFETPAAGTFGATVGYVDPSPGLAPGAYTWPGAAPSFAGVNDIKVDHKRRQARNVMVLPRAGSLTPNAPSTPSPPATPSTQPGDPGYPGTPNGPGNPSAPQGRNTDRDPAFIQLGGAIDYQTFTCSVERWGAWPETFEWWLNPELFVVLDYTRLADQEVQLGRADARKYRRTVVIEAAFTQAGTLWSAVDPQGDQFVNPFLWFPQLQA